MSLPELFERAPIEIRGVNDTVLEASIGGS
jgi:hypothetical protein